MGRVKTGEGWIAEMTYFNENNDNLPTQGRPSPP